MVTIKQQLHHLVDELDDERAPEALSYLQHLIDDGTMLDKNVSTQLPDRMSPLTVPGHTFFAAPAPDDFWPEDETVDEFIAAVRHWRSEVGCA